MNGSGKRWWLVIALLLSVGVNAGILSILAIQRLRGPQETKRPAVRSTTPFEKAADHLHLRGEKRQRFIAIHRRFFADSHKAQARLGVLHRQMRRQFSSSHPDENRIEQIIVELAEGYADLDRVVARTVLESRTLLDRRQEKAYLKMLSRLRAVAMRRPADRDRPRKPQRRQPAPP